MNNFILLNNKKYATIQKDWGPAPDRPVSIRQTIFGSQDVTFSGGSVSRWAGTIRVRNTPDTGYGSYSDLMTALTALTPIPFTDHQGTSCVVVASGPYRPKCSVPDWDSPSAYFDIQVALTKVGEAS